MPHDPAYLRIAGELRDEIVSGELAPGDRVPSQTELATRYGVSQTVAYQALQVLKNEGLVDVRRGARTRVRVPGALITRHGYQRHQRIRGVHTAPFERDVEAAGLTPRVEHETEQIAADVSTARRLGLEPGDPVVYTRLIFYADDIPVQIGHSWEPLSAIDGTEIRLPEESPVSGVVARYDLIGVHCDKVIERYRARLAHPQEIEILQLPSGPAIVIVIDRTYRAGDRVVEVADIVLDGDRYEIVYETEID